MSEPAFSVEGGGLVHVVMGTNGENRIRAEGATRVAANAHSVIARTTAVVMPRPQSFLAEPVADLGEMAEDVTV